MHTSESEQQLRSLIEARAQATRTKSVPALAACFAQDAIGFFLAPPLRALTRDEDPSAWFDTWVGEIGLEMRDLVISAGGEVAYSYCLVHLTGARTTGETVDSWFRETLCFRQIDGEWKITHLHESYPMRMDGSDKAALDLNP